MIGLFIEWYCFELPKNIKKVWANFAWFFAKYFALKELLRDLFAPWKGLTFTRTKRSLDLGDMASAAFGNLLSRFLGALVRSVFIAIGLAVEIFVAAFGIAAYALWLGIVPAIFFSLARSCYLLLIS
jgi:hypothetical protein